MDLKEFAMRLAQEYNADVCSVLCDGGVKNTFTVYEDEWIAGIKEAFEYGRSAAIEEFRRAVGEGSERKQLYSEELAILQGMERTK